MSVVQDIAIEPLTAEAAAGYGAALTFVVNGPTSNGEWWRCWEACAQLSSGRQWVGFVRSKARPPW